MTSADDSSTHALPAARRDADDGDGADPASAAAVTIPLLQESLHVAKRVVDRGGYRISKRIETRTESIDEPLLRQTVRVERRAIGRTLDAALPAPLPRQEGDSWVVPVVEEVLVTEKRLRLVEEVWITRLDTIERTTQHVTLRNETIDIERLDAESPSATGPSNPRSPRGNATSPSGPSKETP